MIWNFLAFKEFTKLADNAVFFKYKGSTWIN